MASLQPLHTSLSDNPRVTFVYVKVLGNVFPQLFEDGSTSGEVKPSKEWVGNGLGNDICRRARDKLDHARWDARLLQQLVYDVVRVRRGRRWLPQYDISNESRNTREVTTDGGEVKG